MSKSSKLATVIAIYIVLTAILAYTGHKVVQKNGAVYGTLAGVVFSVILWFVAGKKYVDKK